MLAHGEEYARRAVQLRHDDALGTIDDERASLGHVGNITQEHFLLDGLELFVVGVVANQAEFRFERHRVGQAPVDRFVYRILGRLEEIVDELQNEVVA